MCDEWEERMCRIEHTQIEATQARRAQGPESCAWMRIALSMARARRQKRWPEAKGRCNRSPDRTYHVTVHHVVDDSRSRPGLDTSADCQIGSGSVDGSVCFRWLGGCPRGPETIFLKSVRI
jgi:hypothetical protein